ncbi:hypothetical protein RZS28_05720 [Methylocapsa polymorpha]|uniref:Uncharacterized protein n=1 Tax=Methylocapsa polymorpha TaxID=3080828 RepID=A0ABZ0HVE7_9HYPH|nr:hypothetical protein RZS28_05720 [Methylocapsa sp. RX1]
MFFLLRVVFWLAIVFASIFWPENVKPPARAEITPKAREILGKTLEQAREGVEKACVSAPISCLEAAVGASQLVGEKRREGKAKAPLDSPAAHP